MNDKNFRRTGCPPPAMRGHLLAACLLALLTHVPHEARAQDGKLTIGNLLSGLKRAVDKPQVAPAPAAETAASQAGKPGSDDALPAYTKLIQELAARNELPEHEWRRTYLIDRPTVQAYTTTSIPGMYSLRMVRPDDPKEAEQWARNMGLLFEWQPMVFFPSDGSGFYVRKTQFGKGSADWIVYDKNRGGFKYGEDSRPYIQQMLTNMDTTGLPAVGKGKPTFILYTSPSCPYSLKVEPLLEKSGMSYRVFPTMAINPGDDLPEVHRIFCADDKLGAWKKALTRKSSGSRERTRDGNWWCSPTTMPVFTLRDLDFVFGQGYSTPSFYFADGSVISGADQMDAVKKKSQEMQARNLYFK